MYNIFFGFKERPFALIPNPSYLFLSKSHEEALAHLRYAISQGDGFVEITGEVGTGKTTLCRTVLERLDKDTEAAYIFNPKLNSIELLKSINQDFEISSSADNIKDLIDNLNNFLVKKKEEGKKIVIIIDEAQHLSKEVLEQLRLLSNLETTTSKLLQIILVGQPELSEILSSYELRQLGQRITLSCRLKPMSFRETIDYINHRIHVASISKTKTPKVYFTFWGFKAVYKYSKGIPRLINIICDRSILTAFGLNRFKINNTIVNTAISELKNREKISHKIYKKENKNLIILNFILICLIGTLLYRLNIFDKAIFFEMPEIKTKQVDIPKKTEKKQIKNKVELKNINNQTDEFKNFLGNIDERFSRNIALENILNLWNVNIYIDSDTNQLKDDLFFFQKASFKHDLSVLYIQADFNIIKTINLPAVIECCLFDNKKEKTCRYLAISRIDNENVTIKLGNNELKISYDVISPLMTGRAFIIWKNFLDLKGIIPITTTDNSIIALKKLLSEIGYKDIKITSSYDKQTQEVIKNIQQKNGVLIDGMVGSITKIILYNENKKFNIPHLK